MVTDKPIDGKEYEKRLEEVRDAFGKYAQYILGVSCQFATNQCRVKAKDVYEKTQMLVKVMNDGSVNEKMIRDLEDSQRELIRAALQNAAILQGMQHTIKASQEHMFGKPGDKRKRGHEKHNSPKAFVAIAPRPPDQDLDEPPAKRKCKRKNRKKKNTQQ